MSTVSTAGCVISVAHELRLGLRDALGTDEDDVRQRAPVEQRPHDRVRLVERGGDDRLGPPQFGQHVRVLRALAGVQEGDLAGRAAAAEDPAAPAAPSMRPGCPTRCAFSACSGLGGQLARRRRSRCRCARRAPRSSAAAGVGGGASPDSTTRAAGRRVPPRRPRRRGRAAQGGCPRGRWVGGPVPDRGEGGPAEPVSRRAGTSAGTAIVAWPLPFDSRPGTCSSSTAWKFVPPKPNALTPATRVAPSGTSQSRSSVLTANGVDDQSTFGFGPRSRGSAAASCGGSRASS